MPLVRTESKIVASRNFVTIGCSITGAADKTLKITCGASSGGGGVVEFRGANTYTGLTTVEGGGGSSTATLTLNRTGGGTLPSGNDVYCNAKGSLQIRTNQTLREVRVYSQGRLIVEDGATLTITRVLTTYPGGVIVNGTRRIIYAAGASLQYYGNWGTSNTSSNEFPDVNGPTNVMVSATLSGTALFLHAPRTISGFISPGKCFVLGNNSFTANEVTNATAPIVTNGTAKLYLTNIGTVRKEFPIAATITTMAERNGVLISNGGGLKYGVRVETGISPALTGSNTAINRTWHIEPSVTPAAPVKVEFYYLTTHGNAGFSGTAPVNVLRYTTSWNPIVTGLAQVRPLPADISSLSGSTTARFVIQNTPSMLAPAPSAKKKYRQE